MSNEQRTAIYAVVTAVLAALGVFGVVNADEQTAYAEAGAQVLAALATLMAAVKTWKQRDTNRTDRRTNGFADE
jgi:protein-S-isoprenylcysteine O-methyltransferase Ste14